MDNRSQKGAAFKEVLVRLPWGGFASSAPEKVAAPSFAGMFVASWRKKALENSPLSRGVAVPGKRFIVVWGVWLGIVGAGCGVLAGGRGLFVNVLIQRFIFILLFGFGLFFFALHIAGFMAAAFHGRGQGKPANSQRNPPLPPPAIAGAAPAPRIALAMAIYHEDAGQVLATIRTVWQSVRRAGLEDCCDFYMLCDSTDPAIRQAEQRVYEQLKAEFATDNPRAPKGEKPPILGGPFYLVRRGERHNFKAGNIAHFLEHYGWAYDYLLTLDADSVLLGATLNRMLARMQANSQLALLQTVIVPLGGSTLFSRAAQYSLGRVFPLYGWGIAKVFGPQCVYWGHNALIRVRAFMDHANLPILPGKPPFGGRGILSHDIIEAALLGRAGYAVEWIPETGGSFDGMPEDILSYGRRDRRWCQGNFQHFWLIFGDGMKPWHRFYFVQGIYSYFTGPLIILMAMLRFMCAAEAPAPLRWGFDPWFVISFLTMVGLPKFLGLARLFVLRRSLASSPHGDGFKRGVREVVSTVFELFLSMLTTPMLFYLHLRSVLEILTGQVITWKAQKRQAQAISWADSAAVFWVPTLLGTLWFACALWFAPQNLPYLMLLLAGWILSIPLAVLTSSPAIGNWIAKVGLLENCWTKEEAADLGGYRALDEIPASSPANANLGFASITEKTGRIL